MPDNINIQIALQCGPLLTNIKIASLLMMKNEQADNVIQIFCGKEISVFIMGKTSLRTSFYLYRPEQLDKYIKSREVADYLVEAGYRAINIDSVIKECSGRYERYLSGAGEFPHEIGLLLGYPVEDVRGFIANNGENAICTGYWKVYHNPDEAQEKFMNYRKSIKYVLGCINMGMDIKELITPS